MTICLICFKLRNDFNQDIGSWDVSNVTNMSWMFENSSFNQDIGSWDVAMLQYEFDVSGHTFQPRYCNWDVSNVTNMSRMFRCK